MKVKLCRDCRYSMPKPGSEWSLFCANVEVNKHDPWALAAAKARGSSALEEREKRFIGACGMSGKLWEPKPTEDTH